MSEVLIEFRTIAKRFGGVLALDGVSLPIACGECHALIGENGAGKSTLGKVLAGIHRPDAGDLLIGGKRVSFSSPADARRAGIGMVHQELAFCRELSVAENLSLGQYPCRLGWFLNRRGLFTRAEVLLAQIGVALDVHQPLGRLSTAQEQLVQIAAAVGTGARMLVFDEPTSSLSEAETQRLFTLMADLRRRGVTMIYISHRLPEVFHLADRISVLRDGRLVGTVPRVGATEAQLVQMMINRPLAEYFPQHLSRGPGREALQVDGLSAPGCEAISFRARAGEIVGLAGLVGAGRSEVARAIFGLARRTRGTVRVDGQVVRPGSVAAALRSGIGLVPEDRRRQGLVLMLSGRANFSLVILKRLARLGLVDGRRERREAAASFERLDVKTPSLEAPVVQLSGGNQQKVVLAKWLACRLKVLIVDEPTRGVDVGAKAAIHAQLDELARQGLAIVLISSELPELLHLASRILVMRGGRLVAEVPRAEANQERVLRLMAGM